jgi:hypothetical protein
VRAFLEYIAATRMQLQARLEQEREAQARRLEASQVIRLPATFRLLS